MSARRRTPDGPTLFDLPLITENSEELLAPPAPPTAARPSPPASHREFTPARLTARLAAGLADLAFLALVTLGVFAGLALADIPIGRVAIAGAAVLLLEVSFLYVVLALAFWGRTPGMAWCGVRIVADDGGLVSFRGSTVRWLVGLVTVASAGLLSLVALAGGRSLADRATASRLVAEFPNDDEASTA